jgi:hypothetical protein
MIPANFACQVPLRSLPSFFLYWGRLAQLVRATGLHPVGRRFESVGAHHPSPATRASDGTATFAPTRSGASDGTAKPVDQNRVYNKKWGARIFIKRRTGILPVIFLSGFMDLAALCDDAEAVVIKVSEAVGATLYEFHLSMEAFGN